MDPLHVAHLIVVALWAGLVLAEVTLELGANTDGARRTAAELHYRLDLLFEGPLLVAVLATGSVLAARAWPLTTLTWVKVGAGLAAVGFNAVSVVAVVLRRRRLDDPEALRVWTWRVRLTGAGLPFFLVAAWLGLVHFRA